MLQDRSHSEGSLPNRPAAAPGTLRVTRIVNACALLELGKEAVLTDPYFANHWFMAMKEPIGLSVAQLPKLAAIIGGHGVLDHWQPNSLVEYPYKQDTPVFVATKSMATKARSAGFTQVEVLDANARCRVSSTLTLEVTPKERALGMKVNNYVLSAGGVRAFVGTEARRLAPLQQYRAEHPAVDVALLPIDGSRFLGMKLVMNPEDALAAAQILGAKVLVPFHYAMRALPPLMTTPGNLKELNLRKANAPNLRVVSLVPGTPWTYCPGSSDS